MAGPPVHIQLDRNKPVVPRRLTTARSIPIPKQHLCKQALDKALKEGVISPQEKAVEWCHPPVWVDKKDANEIRLTVDFTALNQYVLRPVKPFPTAQEIAASIPASTRVLGVLDCRQGYHQLELDEESKDLTTFITPWGRYRYNRCCMGLASAGDEFVARSDAALEGIPGVQKLVDDILLVADNRDQFIERFRQIVERCEKFGITLSAKKIQIGQEVKFGGMIVNDKGVKVDEAKVDAIRYFPPPKNLQDLRSFFGLANQLGSFVPDLAHVSEPLRPLLKPKNAFCWLPEHDEAFNKVKRVLTHPNGGVLAHFDVSRPTKLFTDASSLNGLGFCLIQEDDQGRNRLIQAGSRALKDAETRYAIIELEALGIAWAIRKCRLYLSGLNFTVYTDHKPLQSIFNKKQRDEVENKRLIRILEACAGYTFKVQWVEGKTHFIADALSRYPHFSGEDQQDIRLDNIIMFNALKSHEDLAINDLTAACATDRNYQFCLRLLQDGKRPSDPQHSQFCFNAYWDQLSHNDTLIFYEGDRIMIPEGYRQKILDKLHLSHQGQEYTYKLAKSLYWWPTMKNEVTNLVKDCNLCRAYLPSQVREPLILETASRPMEDVGLDLAYVDGKDYVIMVDRYTGFPWVGRLTSTNTGAVLRHVNQWFTDFGYPTHLRADGGPQFLSEFAEYCRNRNIDFNPSSPRHPQSNGLAESAVKGMKKLLAKSDDWEDFQARLLEWRNCPKKLGYSPASVMFGYRQRTYLPACQRNYERLTADDFRMFAQRREDLNDKVTMSWNERAQALAELKNGTEVWVQNHANKRWTIPGVVVGLKSKSNGRSYTIDVEGKTFVRNRKYLRLRGSNRTPTPEEIEGIPVLAPPGPPGGWFEEFDKENPRRSARIAAKKEANDDKNK